ncbi:hypothetical protein NUSPORA_02173 [Nucleospora cyclopteri]
MARTGSGKTLAYLIPAIQKATDGKNTLILLPTRELMHQVKKVYKILSNRVKMEGKVTITTLNATISVENTDILVVDEFDRVFEEKSLKEHFDQITDKFDGQRVYFSATLPNDPIKEISTIIKLECKIPEAIKHTFFYIPSESKESALLTVLDRNKKTMIFTATRYGVDFLLEVMNQHNLPAKGIYSSMDEEARKTHFEMFMRGDINFLVVTDVAARGIDIPQLDVSISYDLSDEKTFVHRVGRVRGLGESISFVTYSDIFHFFNIKETHLPDCEIGLIPQFLLDKYDLSQFARSKAVAQRGYQRCLLFRKKVSVPSEFKELIDKFEIHSQFQMKDSLADQIKRMRARKIIKKVDCEEQRVKNEYKDTFYIPYSKKETLTHASAFGINKDDYIREKKTKERIYNKRKSKK